MVPTGANGQAAIADYRLGAGGAPPCTPLHVLTEDGSGSIANITVFLDPSLFAAFGLPPTR